jgi:multiple sugar transport system ATP-binding protein
MASVSLRNIAKRFGDVAVMQGIDLDIANGEFVVLVGASGCGKSTLLRMIAGLESITAGDIFIGERRVNDLEPRERDIAMVFQSYALYPHLDVRDNMSFSLQLRKTPAAEIDAQVGQTSGVLNLAHLLERFPRQLSGGQRQRVAMGRAIVRHPDVFLFDEPLSNLDAQLRIAMRTEIRALHQRLGATSIYVTHDQVEAMTMADRMVVMNAGRIEQVGAPLDVYDRPATLYVAKFIGAPSINVVEGVLAGDGGSGCVTTKSGAVLGVSNGVANDTGSPPPTGAFEGRTSRGRESAASAAALAAEQQVHAAFRPEHLRLLDATTGERHTIPGTIDVVENLGHETYVFVGTAEGRMCLVVDRDRRPRVGENVALAVDPARIHVFDVASGARLD